jgi:ribosomal protein L25 (general stress protein Ctc)
MLQTIKQPNNISINQLHNWISQLVCDVWCKADTTIAVENILSKDFKILYLKYEWLKKDIDSIYSSCTKLSVSNKTKIEKAFIANNQIEKLCDNEISLVRLSELPQIVEKKMKPFFEKLYKDLLDKKLSPISKMEYYKEIQILNKFINCPCCGIMPFEGVTSKNREDLDHFFPKAHFPFASINFNNLSPLCGKCNSDNKKDNNPILKKDGKSRGVYYPYQKEQTKIIIEIQLSNDFTNIIQDILVNNLNPKISDKQIKIKLTGIQQEKVDTWSELYNIKNRYFDRSQGFTNSVLRKIFKKKTRLGDYTSAINELINEIDDELYIHEHFIQIPFLRALNEHL